MNLSSGIVRLDKKAENSAEMSPPTKDFWRSCGYHLLDHDDSGGLKLTDEFLKAYLARPELLPPSDACAAERKLHVALLANPRKPVSASDIMVINDSDARENWRHFIAFRDHLSRFASLEEAYFDLVRDGMASVPPLFVDHLVHVILRRALANVTDTRILRAAEFFFRTQRMTLHEGFLIAADEETIGGISTSPISPLISMLGIPLESQIDVVNDANAESYWERSDRFDMALDITTGRDGVNALAMAMQHWIAHLLGIDTDIEAIERMENVDLAWYVGLDAEASKIGDMLWHGETIDDTTMSRIAALFRLSFRDPLHMIDAVRGEPVYMILAMSPEKTIRMKPQNIIGGLPVRHLEIAT
jgi:hypothetical protein